MPGPNSRPSTYEYKPLDMAAGLQVRQSLQKKYEDTQGQLQEQKILAYDTLKDSLFDPNAGENIRKEFDDIYNSAIDNLQTQEDIPQAFDAIRKAQDKLYTDPKVQFYRTMLATEADRAKWQIENPDGYAPLENVPYDQLFQMQQEGKVNIPDLLSTRVGAPDYFNETKAYLGNIPQLQDMMNVDGYTIETISTWVTDADRAAAMDEEATLLGSPTTKHMDAHLAFKQAIFDAVDNGNTNGARKEKLMSQFEQSYGKDPHQAYFDKIAEVAPAFSRDVTTIKDNRSEEEKTGGKTPWGDTFNVSSVVEAGLVDNNYTRTLADPKASQQEKDYAQLALETMVEKTKELINSEEFKDKNLDPQLTSVILSQLGQGADLEDTSDFTKLPAFGPMDYLPLLTELSEVLDKKIMGVELPIKELSYPLKKMVELFQPENYKEARKIVNSLKDSDYISDPENFRNLVQPITRYTVNAATTADKGKMNDFLKTNSDFSQADEVQGYNSNGKSSSVKVTPEDIASVSGILLANDLLDFKNTVFEERNGKLQLSLEVPILKLKEFEESIGNDAIKQMIETNPGGKISVKWDESIDGELASKFLQKKYRDLIRAGKATRDIPTSSTVSKDTPDFRPEISVALTNYNDAMGNKEGERLKLYGEYANPDVSLKIDTEGIKVYDFEGKPRTKMGYALYVNNEPKTIKEIYSVQKKNFDRNEMLDTAENLVGLGKNVEELIKLREAKEKFIRGDMSEADFDTILAAAVNKFGSKEYRFTTKGRMLLHLTGEDQKK